MTYKQAVVSQGEEAVIVSGVREDHEVWGFLCECGFHSRGWPSEALAAERAEAHSNEHETGELMVSTRAALVAAGHEGWRRPAPVTPVSDDALEEQAHQILGG